MAKNILPVVLASLTINIAAFAKDPVWIKDIKAAPITNEVTPSFVDRQFFLDNAPNGIGIKAAQGLNGGLGEYVKVYDIETGVDGKHEDLGLFYQGSVPKLSHHGTAVLGIIRGTANSFGITGIAPAAQLGFWGFIEGDLDDVVPEYIVGINNGIKDATARLEAGDVMVIEQQMNGPNNKNPIAVEYWQEIFDELKKATDKGIICVAAAGNGGENFDLPIYQGRFDLSKRDSGCILVGAAAKGTRERLGFSNYGSRIDAFGYGREVTTTGYGDLFNGGENRMYTGRFSGTSSATPIVAGAVAVISSIAKAQGRIITPQEMRAALRATGTAQGPQTQAERIGSLPNTEQLLKFLNLKAEPLSNALIQEFDNCQ